MQGRGQSCRTCAATQTQRGGPGQPETRYLIRRARLFPSHYDRHVPHSDVLTALYNILPLFVPLLPQKSHSDKWVPRTSWRKEHITQISILICHTARREGLWILPRMSREGVQGGLVMNCGWFSLFSQGLASLPWQAMLLSEALYCFPR